MNKLNHLQAAISAEIDILMHSLDGIAIKASNQLLDAQDEVAISHVLNSCRLILDRLMNAVWTAHNSKRPSSKKSDVYFPHKQSAKDFEVGLEKSQLVNLAADNPSVYTVIRGCQPFANQSGTWLTELFELTREKHEGYVEISSRRERGDTQIGKGQSGHVKRLVSLRDGSVFAEADMLDGVTGERVQLSLTFVEQLNHHLIRTGRNPVLYCRETLLCVAAIAAKIIDALGAKFDR